MGDVLVTGATGGIGSLLTSALMSAGHRVIAIGRDVDGLARLSRTGAQTIAADLAQVGLLAGKFGELDELDALVHCAGVSEMVASVAQARPEMWQQTLTVNVAAAAELTRMALPALRRSRGHVVFVNATPGMTAVPRWSAFVASKAALRELADSLREEEAPNGIRVTSVYPSATATDVLRRIRARFGRSYDAARCIQPASLAAMIVWVLSAPPDAYVSELAVLPAPRSE
jgi:NADP-dependent 3-hydroxy acid dehydrogenase YdfG